MEAPHLINNAEDFEVYLEDIIEEDILERARKQCPNTKWTVVLVTNATFYINHLPDHPIGCVKIELPDNIKYNQAVIGLAYDKHGKLHH